MDIVNYLANIYGYDTPIFLKDVRIGGKSKSAIREEFYRASKSGRLVSEGGGIYYIKSTKEFGGIISFEKVLSAKYLYSKNTNQDFKEFFISGYYSGLTFLNMIGLSQQVPAVLEITTNRVGSKKYVFKKFGRTAYIRKARTTITFQNYKMLQFLDMFYFVPLDEIKKNKELLRKYIKKNQLSKNQFIEYIKLYKDQTIKKIVEGGLIDAFV